MRCAPVLGLLDDIVLVPLGLALVLRWTPDAILADARAQAEHAADRQSAARQRW